MPHLEALIVSTYMVQQTLEKCILSHTEATLCIVSSSVYIQFRNSMFSFQELFFQKQIYVYISIIKTEIKVDSMPLHSHWTFLAFPFAMNVRAVGA